jgi:hypothetical protein
MGILPAGFLRRPQRIAIFCAHRREFGRRNKKGPANCGAFAS